MSAAHNLLIRLREAANGHIAINGEDRPNLFQDAINEINRLRAIEDMATEVFRPIPMNNGRHCYQKTTEEASKNRLDNGRKLGVALGIFKAPE